MTANLGGDATNASAESEAGRIRALINQARELLDGGQSREAALVFGRVLLHDPSCEDARHGLDRSRAASSEADRRLDARFDEAQSAISAGDREGARRVIEAVLEAGGDRDRAMAFLDRLDDRSGVVTLRGAATGSTAFDDAIAPPPRRTLSRRAFAFAWTLLVVTLAAGLAFSWESLVGRLVEAPSPAARQAPPATRFPQPSAGERSVAQARRLLASGDAAGAMSVLDDVMPRDPAYPFAQQMRAQAEAALGRAGSRR